MSTTAAPSSTGAKREDRRERVNQAQHYCHLHLASLGNRTARKPPTQVPSADHFPSCTCHRSLPLICLKALERLSNGSLSLCWIEKIQKVLVSVWVWSVFLYIEASAEASVKWLPFIFAHFPVYTYKLSRSHPLFIILFMLNLARKCPFLSFNSFKVFDLDLEKDQVTTLFVLGGHVGE